MPKSKDLKILEAEIREIRKDIVDSMRFFLEKNNYTENCKNKSIKIKEEMKNKSLNILKLVNFKIKKFIDFKENLNFKKLNNKEQIQYIESLNSLFEGWIGFYEFKNFLELKEEKTEEEIYFLDHLNRYEKLK